jgi:hypothetical protein
MNPNDKHTFTENIVVLLQMAGQDDRLAEIEAARAKKQGIPLEKFEGNVFNDLDRLTAWVKVEVEKFGRPLTADEFNDVIKRGVDEFEKEVLSSQDT